MTVGLRAGWLGRRAATSSGPYGSHAWWRIYVDYTQAGPGTTRLQEVAFLDSVGSTISTSGGTAFDGGLGSTPGTDPADKAFDGTTNSWSRSSSRQTFIGMHFTSAVAVSDVNLTAASSATSLALLNQTPRRGRLQYSDDSTNGTDGTWTDAVAFTMCSWLPGQTRNIKEAAPAAGYSREFRIFCKTNNGDGSFFAIREIEMRATAGGADQCALHTASTALSTGFPYGSNEANAAYLAFNNDTATNVQWAGSGTYNEFIAYIFPNPVKVEQLVITSVDSANVPARTPKDFELQYRKADGGWWSQKRFTSSAWGSIETRNFDCTPYTGGAPAPPYVHGITGIGATGSTPAGFITWGGSQEDYDVHVVIIEGSGEQAAVTLNSGGDSPEYVQLINTTTGSSAGSRLQVFAHRMIGTESGLKVDWSGDHLVYRGMIIKDLSRLDASETDMINASAQNAYTATTSVSIPGVTTGVDGCYLMYIATSAADSGSDQFTSGANSSLQDFFEQIDGSSTQGNGGGFGVWTGNKPAAGATGTTTATLASSQAHVGAVLAWEPGTG